MAILGGSKSGGPTLFGMPAKHVSLVSVRPSPSPPLLRCAHDALSPRGNICLTDTLVAVLPKLGPYPRTSITHFTSRRNAPCARAQNLTARLPGHALFPNHAPAGRPPVLCFDGRPPQRGPEGLSLSGLLRRRDVADPGALHPELGHLRADLQRRILRRRLEAHRPRRPLHSAEHSAVRRRRQPRRRPLSGPVAVQGASPSRPEPRISLSDPLPFFRSSPPPSSPS